MPPAPLLRRRDLLLLVLLAGLTAGWFHLQRQATVDVENVAMKSIGTPEAAAWERRVAGFGRGEELLLDFKGPAPLDESGRLGPLVSELAALPGVAAVLPAPGRAPEQAVVIVRLADATRGEARSDLITTIEQRARATARATATDGELQLAIGGAPVVEQALALGLQEEQRRIVPILAAGLVTVLLLCYRHVGVVLALLAPAVLGIVWTGGIAVLYGRQQNPISVMLQPVLLTVGVASGVHWIEAWREQRRLGLASGEAARVAIAELRVPALLAATTTVVGFLALATHPIPAVAEFGWLAALGVALTYGLAMVVLPALLPLLAPQGGAPRGLAMASSSGDRISALATTLARHSRAIRFGALLVALAAGAMALRIEVDNDPLRILPDHHPVRRDAATLASDLGGSETLDLLVPADSALADDAALAPFVAATAARPGIAAPLGPPERAANGDRLARFLLAPTGSRAREELFAAIESDAAARGAPDVQATGLSVLVARDSGQLIRNTLRGTLGSAALLFVLFWIGLKSGWMACLGLIPNVLPCLLVYGGMALFDRPLTVATAMISSVLLGLIVDDTIHLLHRFQTLVRSGHPPLDALTAIFRGTARAVTITSAVLALGFSLCWFGELTTSVEFGTLAAITIVAALLCDVVLLPALLVAPPRAARAAPTARTAGVAR